MFKRILFSLGVFVLVLAGGVGIVQAAKPEKPVYPTIEEVQQMIATAIAPIQTAINNLTGRVVSLESSIPSPQPTPPYNLILETNASIPFAGNFLVDFVQIDAKTKTNMTQVFEPLYGEMPPYLSYVTYWSVVHAPDQDYYCMMRYLDAPQETARMVCRMKSPGYAYGTPITADIYAEHGGKVVHETINIDTNL